jgi:hypothetical protein
MRAVAAALLFLAACGGRQPTVIDGSSPDAFERTTQAARRDLPDAERLAYDAALKDPPGARFGDTPMQKDALARQAYNGMTARQVVDQ